MLKEVPPGVREKRMPVKENTGVVCARYAAEYLLEGLKEDARKDYLVPPYVALLCAGMEGEINDAYIDFFFKKFGAAYQEFAKPFLFLQFRDRCRTLIPLISDYRFRLNERHADLVQVFKMVELRNQLLHIKHHWHPARVLEGREGEFFDFEYLEPSSDPYRSGSLKKLIAGRDIDAYMKVFNRFIPAFSGLASRIRRRNFNPGQWFLGLKK